MMRLVSNKRLVVSIFPGERVSLAESGSRDEFDALAKRMERVKR